MSGVVLITGASTGIGLATAQLLAMVGYKVYAAVRDPSKAIELQALSRKITTLVMIKLDVTKSETIEAAVNEIYKIEKRIDVLINNAGIGVYGPTESHTIYQVQAIFEVNVFGAIRMLHAVLPIMREQKSGLVINMSSISGVKPSANLPVYSASKAALQSLSDSDVADLIPHGIQVKSIQPGAVITEFEKSTPMGNHLLHPEQAYPNLQKNREDWNSLMRGGQSPFIVAEIIRQMITGERKEFWNPTSELVEKKIKAIYCSSTGNPRIPAKL